MLTSSSVVAVLALASAAFAAPSGSIEKRAPTVYLAGDSTMQTAKGGPGTLQGKPIFDLSYHIIPDRQQAGELTCHTQ